MELAWSSSLGDFSPASAGLAPLSGLPPIHNNAIKLMTDPCPAWRRSSRAGSKWFYTQNIPRFIANIFGVETQSLIFT